MNKEEDKSAFSDDQNSLSDSKRRGKGTDKDNSDEEEEIEEQVEIAIKSEDLIFRPESNLRKWLMKHGKKHCIDFEDEEL